jgi:phage shock protein A
MSDNHNPLMLEFVRRLNAKVDALADDLHDLRHRVTRLEQRLAASAATDAIHRAAITVRLDRMEARLGRIERREETPDRPAEA